MLRELSEVEFAAAVCILELLEGTIFLEVALFRAIRLRK